MVATSASILAESYPTRFFLLVSKTFYLENNSNSGTTTASHNDISYDKLNPTGLWAPFSFFFFFLSFCLWKIHHSHPPHVSPLCVSNTENWHAVNGEIFKGRPGLPISHRGLLFTPSPLLRNQNSLDVTQADWSSVPALERSLARRWQASLELSVRPWRRGSAAGHPQGPINAGVPRKEPIKRPCKTML